MSKIINFLFFFFINLSLATDSLAAVTCNASIPGNTISFGNFSPLANTPIPLTIVLSVTCSGAVASVTVNYTVTFSTGSSGTFNPRKMQSGGNNLNYNLYKDSARTQILGNGTGTVTFSDSYLLALLTSVTRTYTIYATLPAQPLAKVGSYLDTIVATVTYTGIGI